MADDKTIIQNEVNFTSKGIEDVTKKVEILETNLGKVAKQAEAIVTQFEKLGKTHINVNSINQNQSQYKVGRNNFVLRDSKEDKETKTILNKQLEKANEAELQATIAHTNALNADTEKIKKQTEQADAVLEVRQRNSKTNKKNSENRSRYLDKNMNWYKYRDEHPEMFVSRTSQPKYQWGATLSEVGHTVSGLGGAGARIGGDLASVFGMALKNGPLALATQGISKLVSGIADLSKASIQAYSEIETLKTGLSIISPTQVQADTLFRDVADYATRSPYGVAQSTELVTLLKQSGVNDSELMSTLTMLGDTAGGNMEKLKRIANNYAQIVSIGKASMLDMRQFAYAGIPIFEAVSKELGVTQQALRGMISDGKVTSDVIEKVFKDLTSANGIFANATEIGAKTYAARKQNLADTKQLALAEFGDYIINFGKSLSRTEEGAGFKILNLKESFYEGLQQWVDGENLKRDINTIAKQEDIVSDLRERIELNIELGNTEVAKELKKQLEQILSLRDIEKERASLTDAYKVYIEGYNKLKEDYSFVPDFRTLTEDKILEEQSKAMQTNYSSNPSEQQVIWGNVFNYWSRIEDAFEQYSKITEPMRQANRESNTLLAQQSMTGYIDKKVSASNSVANIASQIESAYKETDEYKIKAEEEKKKLWAETIEILKDIKKAQNEDGTLDLTKISAEKLLSYIDAGAISVERNLNVVEGKDTATLHSDRLLLTTQFQDAIQEIYSGTDKAFRERYAGVFSQLNVDNLQKYSKNDSEFYKLFNIKFDNATQAIEQALDTKYISESDKEMLEFMKKQLDISLALYSANTKSAEYDNNDEILKGKGDKDFIPLWKRLLSNATGLSANVISGINSALVNYRDDLAIRNTTGGVLRAGLQGGLGVDFVQQLLKTSGVALELRGDKGGTYQIDWKETGKAVKEFAMQLSASTKVISAYKSGLEAQLNVYETLLSDALVSSETQDIKGDKKFTTAEELSQLAKDYGDQLVNAFGEKLTTKDGLEVSVKNGEFFDQNGNRIAQEDVIVTGNIYEFIRQELPKIRQELADANIQENKRKLTSQLTNNVIDIPLFSKLLQQERNGQRVFNTEEYTALSKSKSFVMTDFDNQLNKVREEYAKEGKEIGSNEEVYKAIVGGTADTTTINAFNEAVELTTQSLRDFLDTMGTQGLLAANYRAEYDRNLLEAANLLSGNRDTNLYGFTPEEVSTDARNQAGIGGYAQREFYGPMLENAGLSPSLYIDDIMKASVNPEDLQAYNNYTQNLTTGLLSNIKTPITPQGLSLPQIPQQSFGEQFNSDMTSSLGLGDLSQQNLPDLPDYEKVSGQLTKANLAAASFKKTLSDASKAMGELASSTLKEGFIAPFEKLGETMTDSSASMSDLKDVYKKLGADLLSNIGPLITNVGLSMAQAGALEGNWGKVAAGLALAAAGGIVGGLGKGLSNNSESEDSKDDEFERLESLKNDLSKLLEQARRDAAYYENNMRHKNALGVNEQFSYRSVNDAIITPQGHVISTHPDDYLIATKQPQNLVGQNTVQPIINNNVINNSSAKVTQETKENDDGTIDIVTIIEEVTSNYISSDRSDDAFAARDYRLKGRQAVM